MYEFLCRISGSYCSSAWIISRAIFIPNLDRGTEKETVMKIPSNLGETEAESRNWIQNWILNPILNPNLTSTLKPGSWYQWVLISSINYIGKRDINYFDAGGISVFVIQAIYYCLNKK